MRTIDMTDMDMIKTKATSSKGNQMKWLLKDTWYKRDHMGYEGLCEVVVSVLLQKSNVKDFVIYEPVKIKYNLSEKSGCYSDNFKDKDEIIVTLEHLYKQFAGHSLAEKLGKYSNPEAKIRHTVEFIEQATGIKNAGEYISILLQLDAFFLNEDRHTNNIAFIYNERTKTFRFCPYFDFGLSLLADTNDYPLSADIFDCVKLIKAKPFDDDFDEQADAAVSIYGQKLKFSFTSNDIIDAVDSLADYYDNETRNRAKEILLQQKRKYSYLF